MAQAEHNVTTRRGFSKWLASMGAAVAVPTAVQAVSKLDGVTANWASFEGPMKAASKRYQEAKSRVDAATDAVARWQKRFPYPPEPFYSSHAERMADYPRRKAEESTHVARYTAVLTKADLGKLRQAERAAYDEAITICKVIADTPVKTLADVREKSRLAQYESKSGPIHHVLMKELQKI